MVKRNRPEPPIFRAVFRIVLLVCEPVPRQRSAIPRDAPERREECCAKTVVADKSGNRPDRHGSHKGPSHMNPDRFTGAGTDQAAEAPFDRAAIEYDRLFEENPVTETIRPLVWRSMLNRFKPGSHILELNCGTGTDAIMLAGHGMHVTATDASAEMISQARSKIRQHHVESSVTLKRMNFEDIHSMNGETFDGAFSNFGGLNCARELPPTLAGLSAVMKPGSYFIACVMNRISLWEIISFLARGRWSAAFRRLPSGGADH